MEPLLSFLRCPSALSTQGLCDIASLWVSGMGRDADTVSLVCYESHGIRMWMRSRCWLGQEITAQINSRPFSLCRGCSYTSSWFSQHPPVRSSCFCSTLCRRGKWDVGRSQCTICFLPHLCQSRDKEMKAAFADRYCYVFVYARIRLAIIVGNRIKNAYFSNVWFKPDCFPVILGALLWSSFLGTGICPFIS